MILKPEIFRKEKPKVSVILPIKKGRRSPGFQRLLDELKLQSFQDFEVILAGGIKPNGRARNEGVKEALGEYLVFMDDSASLGHERVLENLLSPLFKKEPASVGMTGASFRPYPKLNYIQSQYFKMRPFESPIVDQFTDSDKVQHPCLAVPKAVYCELGWESDCLITGTDDDLRRRARQAGYQLFLVPQTWCYYCPPGGVGEIFEKGYRKGRGAAYAYLIFPGLFEFGRFLGKPVRKPVSGLLFRLFSNLSKFFRPHYLLNPFTLLYECVGTLGFISGWFCYVGKKPCEDRIDLPGIRMKKGIRGECRCPGQS